MSTFNKPVTKRTNFAAETAELDDVDIAALEVDKYNFYHAKRSGKEGIITDVIINRRALSAKLKEAGFYRWDMNKTPVLLRVEKNIAEQVEQHHAIEYILDLVEQHPEDIMPDGAPKEMVVNKVLGGLDNYFGKTYLRTLRPAEPLQFIEDTATEAYFFYRNCYVKVTKDGIKKLDYEDLDKLVWRSQIMNRDYKPDNGFEQFAFRKFCYNIAGQNTGRYDSLRTIIGYNLHKYFEQQNRATILTDARITDDPDGRTGKTLLAKSMGFMLNAATTNKVYCEVNGKLMDAQKGHERYNEAEIDTKLVHLNDIDTRYFNIEALYVDITEGITVKKLYRDRFVLKVKILISTNRTIKIMGGSARARVIEFELADHYSETYSPVDEFKHWFFSGWTAGQWNLFDNFMLSCVQYYLANGLKQAETINLEKRKLKEHTAQDFVDFMEDLKPEFDTEYDKKKLYGSFTEQYTDWKQSKGFNQIRFTKWLKLYAEYTPGFKKFNEKDKPYNEPRSNGISYIIFRRHGDTEYLTRQPQKPAGDEKELFAQ